MSSESTLADGRVKDRVANYTGFWQKDMSKEDTVDTENRLDSYTDVVNGMSLGHLSLSQSVDLWDRLL